MSDNNNININTPEIGPYTQLKPFRFWCQKVLPLVYDESLSYYELLCKVVDYLNKTMEDVDQMITDMGEFQTADRDFKTDMRDAYIEMGRKFDQLKIFVETYFDTLDVQTEINNKLDAMAAAGYFNTLFTTLFTDDIITEAGNVTSAWIAENLLQETGYVIDDSLTVQNAAADAKAAGDRIGVVESVIENLPIKEIAKSDHWVQGGFNQDMIHTNTNTNRARIAAAYMPQIPENYIVKVVIPAGYRARIAIYSSQNSHDFVTALTPYDGLNYSYVSGERWYTISPTYQGQYIDFDVRKENNTDFSSADLAALENRFIVTGVSVIGDMTSLQLPGETIVEALNSIEGRLTESPYDWDDFADATYPSGWRIGSINSSGNYQPGSGNAISLVKFIPSESLHAVESLKIEFPGAYTYTWKTFLKSDMTQSYAEISGVSGDIIRIDQSLNAMYTLNLAGFGTGGQDALDADYQDSVIVTRYFKAETCPYKTRDKEAIFFYTPINKVQLFDNTADSYTAENVDTVLMLPETYDPTGKPTPIIFMHHGNSGTVDVANRSWYPESNVWTNFVEGYLDAGYAVFDINGVGSVNTTDANHDYGEFRALLAAYNAYEYIVKNYNVEKQLYCHGSSMGAVTVYAFAKTFPQLVKAAGLFAPAYLPNSAQDDLYKDYIATNYGYANAAAMVADNYKRLVPSAPVLKFYDASGARVEKPFTYDWINDAASDSLTVLCDDLKCPFKTWQGTNDTAIDPAYAAAIAQAYQKAGRFAYFREIENGTHAAGLGGNQTVIDEAVLWFNRF